MSPLNACFYGACFSRKFEFKCSVWEIKQDFARFSGLLKRSSRLLLDIIQAWVFLSLTDEQHAQMYSEVLRASFRLQL